MDLSFTPLQEELRAQARSFLASNAEPTWGQLAELGWTGASVAEEHGGAGLGFLDEAVLHEEGGRALLHAPLWSTSCLLPSLPGADQAAVAAGDASWTLALGDVGDGEREQFGRRIGTYQAVSHPLASSHGELELARSLAWWAAWCVAEEDAQSAVAAASAKSAASEAAVAACERAIQAHGGIGFTWEHELHRLYKRALGIQSWEASPAQLRAEVAGHLLDA